MAALIMALVTGTLFGLGLVISGMVNPAKVIGFLDVAGNWDPTLAMVMGGAVAVTLPAFHFITRRRSPLFAPKFQLPTRRDLEPRLIIGAGIFGIGWGLAGICPGPAFTALSTGLLPVVGFVVAMVAGAAAYTALFENRPQPGSAGKTAEKPS